MKGAIRLLGSLKLTALLLFLSAVLVFFGTLDQVRYGIATTQKLYFESMLAFWQYPEQWPGGKYLAWLALPVPGGYLIGPLMLVNLVTAHFLYFRPRWSRLGIVAIHAGIALLLVGQLVTNLTQEEHFMWLDEGRSSNYLQSFSGDELVVVDITDPDIDRVASFPVTMLEPGAQLAHPQLPFAIGVRAFYANAVLHPRHDRDPPPAVPVTEGIGRAREFLIERRPPVTEHGDRNLTTAVVEITADGRSAGTWLVCNAFEDQFPAQAFEHRDRRYEIALRFKRTYLPFSLTLRDFVHERYPGSEIPKHFESRVRLDNPETGEDREVGIFMNNPLRYAGWTFFQASFAKGDAASMFQVVKNPGWLLPYVASALVSLGLLYQFGWSLWKAGRREAPR